MPMLVDGLFDFLEKQVSDMYSIHEYQRGVLQMFCLLPDELFEQTLWSQKFDADGKRIHRCLAVVICNLGRVACIANMRQIHSCMSNSSLHRGLHEVRGKWCLDKPLPPALTFLYVSATKILS
jgi:hypothetical protein